MDMMFGHSSYRLKYDCDYNGIYGIIQHKFIMFYIMNQTMKLFHVNHSLTFEIKKTRTSFKVLHTQNNSRKKEEDDPKYWLLHSTPFLFMSLLRNFPLLNRTWPRIHTRTNISQNRYRGSSVVWTNYVVSLTPNKPNSWQQKTFHNYVCGLFYPFSFFTNPPC